MPHSACQTTFLEAPDKHSRSTPVPSDSRSTKAPHRIRSVPGVVTGQSYRFYLAIGLTQAFDELLRLPIGRVTLSDFMRLHGLIFASLAPWAGKLRSRHTEVVIFRRAAAASFDVRTEMRLASLQFEALMRNAKDSLDLIVAIAFLHARIIYIQPAAEGNEFAAQVLTDLQLRRIFCPTQLEDWPSEDAYVSALTVAAGGDLTPLVQMINARLQERKALLPAGRVIQSPFDVLSRNWTSRDKNLADSKLLQVGSRSRATGVEVQVRRRRDFAAVLS